MATTPSTNYIHDIAPSDSSKASTPHQFNPTTFFRPGPSASEFARTYNSRTGGCNIQLATHLISLTTRSLPSPPSPLRILDNACGPLVLTHELLASPALSAYPAVHISAVDINADFIANNRKTIAGLQLREGVCVDTDVMDGMDLRFPDAEFDVSYTSLGIFAFPDPVKGVRELRRTLKDGGVAALTTWKRVGWLPLLHQVEALVRPGKEVTQFPFLEEWSVPGKLKQTMVEGGFRDVSEEEVVAYAWFESVEAAAGSVCDTLGMMVGRDWGVGETEKMREGFRAVIGGSEKLERGEGGKVGFEMVAWTGVGRK